MAIGPFDSFAFPGVYTKTLNEAPLVSSSGALRFPAFIGVGEEVTAITAYEMIRGSSSMADNKITKEDLTAQALGTNRDFQVSFFPITTGAGTGTVATDPRSVIVYVNGESVPIASIDATNGIVYLMSFPAAGDTVEATYYFKRQDTLNTNEDLSIQVDGVNRIFKVSNVPIVDGSNGGITTTDPSKVIVKVNGTSVGVTAVDGDSGRITLTAVPVLGATVTVTYYSNVYQDTSDILPSDHVNSITKIGYSSTSQDFVDTVDFVLDTTGTFNTINWGNSYKFAQGSHTVGATYLSAEGTLYDNLIYRRPTAGTSDGTNLNFTLGFIPTSGTGQGKGTDNPNLITAYVGATPTIATVAQVKELSASTKVVTLKVAPTAGQHVYVTQYQNQLPDDNWTLSSVLAGVASIGTYSISGVISGQAYNIVQNPNGTGPTDTSVADPNFSTENVTYPNGTGALNSDGEVMPGYGVNETISLSFLDATRYVVTSSVTSGSGTLGDNTGYLNQTYIDGRTGFRVTINQGSTVVYTVGDHIRYDSSSVIVTGSVETRAVPGIRVAVADTVGVTAGDAELLNTYNKSGSEPKIGDFYYVSFLDDKEFDDTGILPPVFVTLEKDALAYSGALTISNKLGLAAHLAFLNGAPAMALLQLQKTSGGADAPDAAYMTGIDYFSSPMTNGLRPSLMEPVTTSIPVLTYLKTANTIQSSIRYINERMSYFGFANNTSPSSAMVFAQSMNNERMIGLYPDGGIVTLVDDLGNNVDYIVDGSLLAAAVSGRDTSPAYDVAEPLLRKPVVGFSRLFRRVDPVTQAQVCNAGVTILEQQPAGILVKMDLTTDLSSVLTRTPSVIRIKDFVQKGTRTALTPYIGTKFLPSRTSEIENTLKSYLSSLVSGQIIAAFTGVKASPDANEPTTVNVVAYYSPILPLNWIIVTFNLRSRI
jgi:hypothetical protein